MRPLLLLIAMLVATTGRTAAFTTPQLQVVSHRSRSRSFCDSSSSSSSSSFEKHTRVMMTEETTEESDVLNRSTLLNEDEDNAELPQFGQVVGLRRPSTGTVSSSASSPSILIASSSPAASRTPSSAEEDSVAAMIRRNVAVAIASVMLALGNYFWHYTHPITSVQLLATMQEASQPLSVIGTNNKPTVVDFWAPWCENCKLAATTFKQVEEEYKDQINFVMVNGDESSAWDAIEAFGVDAIPHLALVDAKGNVETALIGPIPKHILEQDLQVLIQQTKESNEKQTPLPHQMLDAFANRPESRRVHFDP